MHLERLAAAIAEASAAAMDERLPDLVRRLALSVHLAGDGSAVAEASSAAADGRLIDLVRILELSVHLPGTGCSGWFVRVFRRLFGVGGCGRWLVVGSCWCFFAVCAGCTWSPRQ